MDGNKPNPDPFIKVPSPEQTGRLAEPEKEIKRGEKKLAEATLAADSAEARALLDAAGTVVDRQAMAKLSSEAERFAEAIARAEYNRVKTKLRLLEQAQMHT